MSSRDILYSAFNPAKILVYADAIKNYLETEEIPRPAMLSIDPANPCTDKCIWCSWYQHRQKEGGFLPIDVFDSLVEDSESMGIKGFELCVHPDSEVRTPSGYKPISQVKKGEQVLTGKGRFREVEEVFKRKYDGDLIVIKPKFDHRLIKLTAEHPVLVYRTKQCPRETRWNHPCKPTCAAFKRCGDKTLGEQKFVRADELTIYDFLLYPSMTLANDEQGKEDYFEFCGLYVAEGSLTASGKGVTLHLAKNEEGLAQRALELGEKVFGVTGKIDENTKRGDLHVNFFSKTMAEHLSNLFGKKSYQKHVPEEFLTRSEKEIIAFLRGFWLGDGSRNGGTVAFHTSSKKLAEQIRDMCYNIGVLATITVRDRRGQTSTTRPDIITKRISYDVRCGGAYAEKLRKNFGIEYKPQIKMSSEGWTQDGITFIPIRAITREKYSGYVFNLKVKEDHTYVVGCATTHNCGGGEPLLHPDAEYIVRTLAGLGRVLLVTNGNLLTEEIAVHSETIRVSLDAASDETYRRLHRSKDFKKVTDNIAMAAELTRTGVGFLYTPFNRHEIVDVAALAKNLGCEFVQIRPAFTDYPVIRDTIGYDYFTWINSEGVYDKILADIQRAKELYEDKNFKVYATIYKTEPKRDWGVNKCVASLFNPIVTPSGGLWICCERRGTPESRIGTIGVDGSLEELWLGDRHLELISQCPNDKCPAKCKFLGYNKVIQKAFVDEEMDLEWI